MRTSLIIFGVIFLVIGILLYLIPMQQVKADTTTTEGGNTDVRTSSARVTVPIEWSFASGIIGFVLLILGLVIPGPIKVVQGPRGPRGRGPVHHRHSTQRRTRGAALPKGTSVTTTTRIKR